MRDGISEEEMLLSVSEALDGPALTWYCNNEDNWNSYAEFVADARNWFDDGAGSKQESRNGGHENDYIHENSLDEVERLMEQLTTIREGYDNGDCVEDQLEQLQHRVLQLLNKEQTEVNQDQQSATSANRQDELPMDHIVAEQCKSREKEREFSKQLRRSLDERPGSNISCPADSPGNELRSDRAGSNPLLQ